jgi:hypothetical protein
MHRKPNLCASVAGHMHRKPNLCASVAGHMHRKPNLCTSVAGHIHRKPNFAFDYKHCRFISDLEFLFASLESRNNYEHRRLILSHVCWVMFLIVIIINHNFYK